MSHHIPDVTKMISDTPRMKAAQMAAMEHMTGDVYRVGCDIEQQLNAANQRVKRLEEAYSASEALHTVRDCACCDSPDVWIRCSTCCDKIKRYHVAKANLNRTEEAKEAKP